MRIGRFFTSLRSQRYSQVSSENSIFHLEIKERESTLLLADMVSDMIAEYSPGPELLNSILDTAPVVVAGLRGRR